MGVRGLWWFLVNNCEQGIFRSFDLVKEASRSEDGLTLIVDFYPFEYWIINQVHRDTLLEKSSTNPYISVNGGEYNLYGECVVDLVKALADVGIKLVVVVTAGRCSSTGQMDFKFARWLQTDIRDMKKVDDVLQLIEGSDESELLKPNRESKSPTLLPLELVERLRQAGCEVLCSLDGEADPYIAQLRYERRAFAILSNDSDMLLFENSRYINLEEHFDTSGRLASFLSSDREGKLEELMVKCVFTQDVYAALDLPNIDAACDLSFVLGNDVSKQFPDLYRRLNLARFSVKGVAARIAKFGPLTTNSMFKGAFNDPNIKEAHRLTHELYKMELTFGGEDGGGEGSNEKTRARQAINQAVLHCRIAGYCLPMSRGFYWQDAKIVETNDVSSLYSAESACLPLRLALYKMLMFGDKDEIVEYRPLKTSQLTERLSISLRDAVEENTMLADLPKFHEIGDMPRQARLDLFDRIVNNCYADQENVGKYDAEKIYERFDDWPIAFRVYSCRLIWLANRNGKNLRLTLTEMESIIASVFAIAFRFDSDELGIAAACKPTRRSLTVGSFVQVAYRYMYSSLAKMLSLAELNDSGLPLPSAFFLGSLFTAMFCQGQDTQQVEAEAMAHITRIRSEILEKHRNIVESVFA